MTATQELIHFTRLRNTRTLSVARMDALNITRIPKADVERTPVATLEVDDLVVDLSTPSAYGQTEWITTRDITQVARKISDHTVVLAGREGEREILSTEVALLNPDVAVGDPMYSLSNSEGTKGYVNGGGGVGILYGPVPGRRGFSTQIWVKAKSEPTEPAPEPESEVEALHRQVRELKERETRLWEALAKEADDRDWCSEYDQFARANGGPARTRDYTVTLQITREVVLTIKAESSDSIHNGDHTKAIEDALLAQDIAFDDYDIRSVYTD